MREPQAPRIVEEREHYTMTITIINKAVARDQKQQNGPCPYLVDSPLEPKK